MQLRTRWPLHVVARRAKEISESRTSAGLRLQQCNACKIILLSWHRLEDTSDQGVEQVIQSCLNSAIKVEWLLVPLIADHERDAAFANADGIIGHLREFLRGVQMPLLESDRLRGQNEFLKGKWYWAKQDTTAAINALTLAVTCYTEAVTRQPQNRIWRMEQAAVQTQLADYYASLDNLKLARDATNASILNYVHILETDPKDLALRVSVIESLIRFGELSLEKEEYQEAYRGFHTAAQDCRLLTGEGELEDWGFKTRVWALVQALRALDRPSTATELIQFEKQTQVWLEQIGSGGSRNDVDWARQMLDSRSLPDRVAVPVSISNLQKRHRMPTDSSR